MLNWLCVGVDPVVATNAHEILVFDETEKETVAPVAEIPDTVGVTTAELSVN